MHLFQETKDETKAPHYGKLVMTPMVLCGFSMPSKNNIPDRCKDRNDALYYVAKRNAKGNSLKELFLSPTNILALKIKHEK